MSEKTLFDSVTLGPYQLKNRIFLPPLTRSRSDQPGNIPSQMMVDYYSQRTSAGFMVTEGTQIEPRGQGYAWTPGIHSQEQIEGWKKVTQAVHDKGGIIFSQLWHVGRVSHTSLQPNNAAPIAPSAIQTDAVSVFIETGPNEGILTKPSAPRALETHEVKELVAMYGQAASNAKKAGFDGVELHCANGYLVNQFISEHTNHRNDKYGGNLENRLRFLTEIVAAVVEVFGKDKVGVRFAPLFESTNEDRVYLGLVESDPLATYIAAIKLLNDAGIAYLSLAEADWENAPDLPEHFYQAARANFANQILYAGKYTQEKAKWMLDNDYGDLFGFGRPFIANPDLPARFRNNWPLNEVDPSTMYGGKEGGYSDYPRYEEA